MVGEEEKYELQVDTYADVITYLSHVHPDFKNYMRRISTGDVDSLIVLLDSEFNVIPLDRYMGVPKEGEVLYLCPTFSGEKGKGLKVLAAIAILVALSVTTVGFAGVVAGKLTLAEKIAFYVAFSLISSALQTEPPGSDSSVHNEPSRGSDLFGSLRVTTSVNTRIPLHYGKVRGAGHLISGYKESVARGKNDVINVHDMVGITPKPNSRNNGRVVLA